MLEGQEGLTWERWFRIADRVESLGLDSLWRSDHFFSLMGHLERPALECWTSLTALAQRTQRLRFGPLVSPMTFRHPALLARMAAAVDGLSSGRLILGLGAGWNDAEHQAFGISLPPLKERFDRLEERVERRIDGLEERIDRRMDGLQASVDAMRSDLTQVALAVGVRPRATNA